MSQVIGGRGRLFSRFNVIDAAVLIVILIVVPMTYVAYRTFRQPLPVITSIKPSTLSVDSGRRVRLDVVGHDDSWRLGLWDLIATVRQSGVKDDPEAGT